MLRVRTPDILGIDFGEQTRGSPVLNPMPYPSGCPSPRSPRTQTTTGPANEQKRELLTQEI